MSVALCEVTTATTKEEDELQQQQKKRNVQATTGRIHTCQSVMFIPKKQLSPVQMTNNKKKRRLQFSKKMLMSNELNFEREKKTTKLRITSE